MISDLSCALIGSPDPLGVVLIDIPPSRISPIAHGAMLDSIVDSHGKKRWWFRCLHPSDHGLCLASCRTLYRTRTSPYFGCLSCIESVRALEPALDLADLVRSAFKKRQDAAMWHYVGDYNKGKSLALSISSFSDFVQKHLQALNGPPSAGQANVIDLSEE